MGQHRVGRAVLAAGAAATVGVLVAAAASGFSFVDPPPDPVAARPDALPTASAEPTYPAWVPPGYEPSHPVPAGVPGAERWVLGGLPAAPAEKVASVSTVAPAAAPRSSAAAVGAPSRAGSLGIPVRVMQAYQQAARQSAAADPACRLSWEVLAGIGRIESRHANGGRVTAEGVTFEPILGPVLDGSPFRAIGDSDGGRWDGNRTWDRAVGPMQFLPGTWRAFGRDGDGDGSRNPHDVDDATRAAAAYLCAGSADLSHRASLQRALLRYNRSTAYVAAVLSWADAYADGKARPVANARPTPTTKESASPSPKPKATAKPTTKPKPTTPTTTPKPTTRHTPTPRPTPTARPTETPTPTATPSAEATPTEQAAPSASEATSATASPTATAGASGSATADPTASSSEPTASG